MLLFFLCRQSSNLWFTCCCFFTADNTLITLPMAGLLGVQIISHFLSHRTEKVEPEARDSRQASRMYLFLYFFGLSWLFDRVAEEVMRGNRMREMGVTAARTPALPTKLNGRNRWRRNTGTQVSRKKGGETDKDRKQKIKYETQQENLRNNRAWDPNHAYSNVGECTASSRVLELTH